LRKNTKTVLARDLNTKSTVRIDELDLKIISLMVSGSDNKQISKDLKVPLSTIQRRTRMILAKDIIRNKVEPNYKKLGYNKGMIHVSIKGCDVSLAAQKLAEIDGIVSVAVHLGTSDIVAEFVYLDSTDVLKTISKIWNIEGTDRVTWSQEVYTVPVHNKNVISILL
jgi:DNA-binding Lrp family transcriptional regulator